MNCSFCNAKIPDGAKTCPACGAAVGSEDGIPSPSPYFTETVGEPEPAPKKRVSRTSTKAASIEEPVTVEAPVPPAPDAAPAEIVEQSAPAAWEPPIQLKSLADDKANWAIASLVLGVVGLAGCVMPGCCTILSSLPAIILGAMSLKSSKRGFAIAGIVLGIVGFVILVAWILIMVLGIAYGNTTSN
jgi:hypothetical protein